MSQPLLSISELLVEEIFDAATAATEQLRGELHQPPVPWRNHLRDLMECAFWASLQTEEGRPVTFSIQWRPRPQPDSFSRSIIFPSPIPLTVEEIRKLAPALAAGNTAFGVFGSPSGALIWGLVQREADAFEIRVPKPGFLVVEYGGKRIRAVLGKDAFTVAPSASALALIAQAMGKGGVAISSDRIARAALLLGLSRGMRRHGNGGAIFAVPVEAASHEKRVWSLAEPKYGVANGSDQLHQLGNSLGRLLSRTATNLAEVVSTAVDESLLFDTVAHVPELRWLVSGDALGARAQLVASIAAVAKLTAVDGAVLVDHQLRLLGFGVRLNAEAEVPSIHQRSAISERQPRQVLLHKIGGTRHGSAVRFVHALPGTVGLVASHDGQLTLVCNDALDAGAVQLVTSLQLLLD